MGIASRCSTCTARRDRLLHCGGRGSSGQRRAAAAAGGWRAGGWFVYADWGCRAGEQLLSSSVTGEESRAVLADLAPAESGMPAGIQRRCRAAEAGRKQGADGVKCAPNTRRANVARVGTSEPTATAAAAVVARQDRKAYSARPMSCY